MVRISPDAGRCGASGGLAGAAATVDALRVRVTGVVQGVGFRPFVHRLAVRHRLAGWVRNEAGEVMVRVEGTEDGLRDFLTALWTEAPVLARIDRVETEPVPAEALTAFHVLSSGLADTARVQPIPPDVATCDACLAELADQANRRYGYPFITCTDCGPRFTVVEGLPYERARTSMRRFTECPACRQEFESPDDRRFRSETNSCAVCGPHLWLERGGRRDERAPGAVLDEAAALLLGGAILAIRGLGGFHLAVDATSDAAVRRLRERKRREAKPLAVMVRTLAEAERLARFTPDEADLLTSRERPIVLIAARPDRLAPSVHPGLDRTGLMLAYTPIHHLLLARVRRPLVMTSGNLAEEPIACGLDEARERLGAVADAFLMHDREIVARADDSVVRHARAGAVLSRRARGHAPLPLDLPVASSRPLLAVGPHLKNTATLVRGRQAFMTPHVGDLESVESLDHFRHLVAACQRLFHVAPEVVVRDLHPGYLSTRIAEEAGLPVLPVQHHHAHLAAVLAEHGRRDSAIGLIFDGTGHGEDGAVWGGEVLFGDLSGFRRLAHLRYAPLPGGDLAARRPWRAALGYLTLEPGAEGAFQAAFEGVDPAEVAMARHQVARHLNAPPASSMGRLFDAASAVVGLRRVAYYEGQAAMELEALAGRRRGRVLPIPVREEGEAWQLDPLPLLIALGEGLRAGREVGDLAADFHASLVDASARAAVGLADMVGVSTVALGGGVFQNARLLDGLTEALATRGLDVLVPRRLSPNDGAISFGQAAVGAAQLHREG